MLYAVFGMNYGVLGVKNRLQSMHQGYIMLMLHYFEQGVGILMYEVQSVEHVVNVMKRIDYEIWSMGYGAWSMQNIL